jgi:hypothetical protein
MEEMLILEKPVRTTERKARTNYQSAKILPETKKDNLMPDKHAEEVGEDFKNYLNWHGLANEDNLLVLSSQKHYYYDYEELKEVTTLINLKKLNLIKHLDDFLHSVYNGLSPKTNFIGCFADTKSQKGVSLISRVYKKFINILDARIDADINSREFSRLLESHGFRIIDMTEINGLTYFRTQNQ